MRPRSQRPGVKSFPRGTGVQSPLRKKSIKVTFFPPNLHKEKAQYRYKCVFNLCFIFLLCKQKKKEKENHVGWKHNIQILHAAPLKESVDVLRHIPGYYPCICAERWLDSLFVIIPDFHSWFTLLQISIHLTSIIGVSGTHRVAGWWCLAPLQLITVFHFVYSISYIKQSFNKTKHKQIVNFF